MDLAHPIRVYHTIRDRITALEANIDEQTLVDTLEGLTDLHEMVAAIVRSALFDDAFSRGAEIVHHHTPGASRTDQRTGRRARQIARDAMIEVDLKAIKAPDFTLSLRTGSPALVVHDEGAVPQLYWEPREPRLNRLQLLADLKRGMDCTHHGPDHRLLVGVHALRISADRPGRC